MSSPKTHGAKVRRIAYKNLGKTGKVCAEGESLYLGKGLFAEGDAAANHGDGLGRDVEEGGNGRERQVLDDAGAAAEQQVVALAGRSTVEVEIAGPGLIEQMLTDAGAQLHRLHVLAEQLHHLLAADSQHAAGHHRLDGGQRRAAVETAGIVARELVLEREPCDVFPLVADALHRVLEAALSHEAEPLRRLTLARQQLAFLIADGLALLLAEVAQQLKVEAVAQCIESLFHRLLF